MSERMTMAEVFRLAREGRLEGTWQSNPDDADGVFIRVSNEGIQVSDERHLPAVVPQPEPASEQPTQKHRPSSFAYLDESMAGGGVSGPRSPDEGIDHEPTPIRGRALIYGPYKGVPIEDVPTEHLEWHLTAFENGPEPIVVAELARRASNKSDAQHD